MKYVMVVLGGAADHPVGALYGKTPLQAAHLPTLDIMARDGLLGGADLIPEEVAVSPEVAALALLGYPPARTFTGPAPLDAAARDVPMDRSDVAFRLDLVSSNGDQITDPTAGGIAEADAQVLLRAAAERLRDTLFTFYPGRGRRLLLVWSDGPVDLRTLPPGAAAGKPLAEVMPEGEGDAKLRSLIYNSLEILDGHEINERRRDAQQPTANMLWPWGHGRRPSLPSFAVRRGVGGAVISPALYWRGLARLAGMVAPELPGATGRIETDYAGKVKEALAAREQRDFALLHLGGPGAASARGDAEMKVDALERVDERALAPLLRGLKPLDDFRVLVVPDVVFPVEERRPTREPVPFLLYASRGIPKRVRAAFDETAIEEARLRIEEGHRLIDLLFQE